MPPTTLLQKLSETTQTISFSEGDGVCSAEVVANDVVISTNAGAQNHGSSKVKLKSLVDYNWESKHYNGQLLALHISGKYLAYSIKAPNTVNPGTWSGMIRVMYTNVEPGADRRALIKGMKGEVNDLSFAHMQNQVILASIDDQGNFYIHDIKLTENGLKCTLLAEVLEDTGLRCGTGRVVWCPYIPDDDDDDADPMADDDDDVARLLLTTHGNTGRIWPVGRLVGGEVRTAGGWLRAGAALVTADHSDDIIHAAFSPDGTALATASLDSYVMFFQVYKRNNTSPRCLHKWQPHGGKPLSCLFFLDNYKNYNSDVQFWKFALTGADNNTVLKVWSCKSWTCLQTITFAPSPSTEPNLFGLKAMVDNSSNYVLLSDAKTRSLYVLYVVRNKDDNLAYCKNISEFLLPYPVLSYCIVDAGEAPKCESSCGDPYHRNGSSGDIAASPDEFDLNQEGASPPPPRPRVRVRLFIVQPKGLQQGELAYTAAHSDDLLQGLNDLTLGEEASDTAVTSSILAQQSQQLKNLLMRTQTQPGSLMTTRPDSPAAPHTLNLMTPDAFSSPGKREEDDPPLSATPDITKHRPPVNVVVDESEPSPCAVKFTSGGSSPSREVEEIMALNDETDYYKEQAEELSQPSEVEEPAAAAVPNGETAEEPNTSESDWTAKQDAKWTQKEWPAISIAQINEAIQRKASSEKSSNPSLNASAKVAANEEVFEQRPALNSDERARLESLESKIDKLTELLVQQSIELRAMRSSLSAPRELVEGALRAHDSRTAAAIDAAMADGWKRIASSSESVSKAAAAAAGAGAARALEPLAAALQSELAAKLSATDHLLRDNIDKLANSKTIMERLSHSIASSLSDMVRSSFRDALVTSVVPVMEKAHAQIFRQINQAFQNGTKEFAMNTEAAARAAAERGGAVAAGALRSALERHADALHAAHSPQHIAAVVRDVTHGVLEKELVWWREEVRSVVCERTRIHSPAPSTQPDRQVQVGQIQALISSGDVNGAFQLALSAADLSLVVAACRAAEPGALVRLRPHVLLSLVQQLAADMTRDTQIKHKFLEEAIMNLDTQNPVTREHLPAVVKELKKQIIGFMQTNPGHPLRRQFKILLMATESLLNSSP